MNSDDPVQTARVHGLNRAFIIHIRSLARMLRALINISCTDLNTAGLDCSGCASDWRSGGCGFEPQVRTPPGRQYSVVEVDHEIFSSVIFSLLIQEGQLSVFGERMCTILVNRLED